MADSSFQTENFSCFEVDPPLSFSYFTLFGMILPNSCLKERHFFRSFLIVRVNFKILLHLL